MMSWQRSQVKPASFFTEVISQESLSAVFLSFFGDLARASSTCVSSVFLVFLIFLGDLAWALLTCLSRVSLESLIFLGDLARAWKSCWSLFSLVPLHFLGDTVRASFTCWSPVWLASLDFSCSVLFSSIKSSCDLSELGSLAALYFLWLFAVCFASNWSIFLLSLSFRLLKD